MEAAPDFDLQSHSSCSDGALTPEALVAAAADAGVRLLAVSDHDTLDGVAAARAAAATDDRIRVVPAVEISALDRGQSDLHILGYCVDPDDRRLREVLELARTDRASRADRMADTLAELGFAVDRDQLAARRRAGNAIGRPHLAEAVTSHPDNAARLAAEDVADPTAFLVAYLTPGRPAFHRRAAPTVAGAIELIHDAGGVAVWAHPFWDFDSRDTVHGALAEFQAAGLDGVEAFYTTHTAEQARALHAWALELDLLTTGSADFHGPVHARFNRFRAFHLYGLEPRLGPLAEVS